MHANALTLLYTQHIMFNDKLPNFIIKEIIMEDMQVALALRNIDHKTRRFIDNNLKKKTIERVTGTNGFIIGYIAENSHRDVFQRDIEREYGITRSTTSKIISLMISKGLIETGKVSSDGRLKKLMLTKKAKKLAELMQDDSREVDKKLTNGFTPDEIKTLLGYLARIEKNLSE